MSQEASVPSMFSNLSIPIDDWLTALDLLRVVANPSEAMEDRYSICLIGPDRNISFELRSAASSDLSRNIEVSPTSLPKEYNVLGEYRPRTESCIFGDVLLVIIMLGFDKWTFSQDPVTFHRFGARRWT